MRKDKSAALKLRLSGRSYNEINQNLGVPKSTLSNWFTGLQLSNIATKRINSRVHEGSMHGLIKRNRHQTHLAQQRMRSMREEAAGDIKNVSQNELKLIGIALYWAEGYKRPIVKNGKERTYHPVAIANSDPLLIKLFMRFLRETCEVSDDQITASIRIYEHMNENDLLYFWQKVTRVPLKNFQKTYYGVSKSSQNRRPFNRLPYGTIAIRVNSTQLFHKIMGWLQGLAKYA